MAGTEKQRKLLYTSVKRSNTNNEKWQDKVKLTIFERKKMTRMHRLTVL